MNRGTRTFWLLVALLLGASVYFGIGAERRRRAVQHGGDVREAGRAVRVARVLDGDSVLVATASGHEVPVHLAGIRAFTGRNDKDPVTPFGMAARAELERLSAREPVQVRVGDDERDVQRDRFGRVIGRITSDGEDAGLLLLQRGLVVASREPGFQELEAYLAAEREARQEHRGLWAVPAAARRADELILRAGEGGSKMIQQLRHFFLVVLRRPPVSLRVVVLIAAILTYGTTGFLFFELPENPDLKWADGFWYSVVTITTVGYGDLAPATLGGRFVVALPLMFFGIGMLGYVLSVAASTLIEAKNKELHGMGSFRLSDHLVIVNFSDLGKVERVLSELSGDDNFREKEVVLLDEDLDDFPPSLAARGLHLVRGNPTRDETLTRASIDTASHVLVLSKRPGDPHTDGQSVSVTLAIEARSPNIVSVVECVDPASEELMRKAGADRVVCASRFDAHFLTHEMINPGIQEIVEQLTSNQRGQQLFLTTWPTSCPYAEAAEASRQRGHLPLGVRKGGRTLLNPPSSLVLQPGDHVITIGERKLEGRDSLHGHRVG